MITKIRGEQPFQVLASNFSISPSNEGYTLQISADGENYSNLFSVGANVTRMVTGVANGSYYRLSGNSSEVEINWRKQCSTGGSDADLSNYYTKAETDSAIENAMSGISVDLSDYYTSAQTESAIQSAITAIDLSSFVTSGEVETQITSKNYATQSQIPDVSSFVTSAQVESQITSKNYATVSQIPDVSSFVTSGYVENAIASIDIPDVSSIEEHISTVEQVTALALNELKGEISGITIPDVSNFVTSGDVETQINEVKDEFDYLKYSIAFTTSNNTSAQTKSALFAEDGEGGAKSYLWLTNIDKTNSTLLNSSFDYDSATKTHFAENIPAGTYYIGFERDEGAVDETPFVVTLTELTNNPIETYETNCTYSEEPNTVIDTINKYNYPQEYTVLLNDDVSASLKWTFEKDVERIEIVWNEQEGKFDTNITYKNYITSADTASQISNSLSGYSTTQQMNTAINSAVATAVAHKVSSTTITNIVSLSQADYDALTVKDPNTLYLINNVVS